MAQAFIITTGLRFVIVSVCVAAAVAAVVRRAQLRAASELAAFGFSALAVDQLVYVGLYAWQLAVTSRHEPIQKIALALGLLLYATQALAVVGIGLVALAVFVGRPSPSATPNNRWSGP